jgi:hypothetical protein
VKPVVHKGEMEQLYPAMQGKICKCERRCRRYVSVNTDREGFMMCEMAAKEYAFEILHALDVVSEKKAFPQSVKGWTTEQERFIKKYITENNVIMPDGKLKYGTCSLLAEMLMKTRDQVKDKIRLMRREGKLPVRSDNVG